MKLFLIGAIGLGIAFVSGCSSTAGEGSGAGPSVAQRDRTTESDEAPETRRARVRLELASAYYSRGQLSTALDEVKLSLAADPKLVPALNLRGLIYAGLGEHTLAEDSFKRAIQLDPRDADTMQNFGWYLCQRARYDEAETYFDRVLSKPLYNNVQRTLVAKGVCQARSGALEPAEQTLIRAHEIDPASTFATFSLADVLYKRAQYDRARFYARRINLNPDLVTPSSLWLGARIENKLGNVSGVTILGRQLKERFPGAPETAAFDKGRFDD
jgi:type IV pilus assembly protein PilF